jgi:hypothetical protein
MRGDGRRPGGQTSERVGGDHEQVRQGRGVRREDGDTPYVIEVHNLSKHNGDLLIVMSKGKSNEKMERGM